MKIIQQRHADYYKSPAVGECDCGARVVLSDPLDNFCTNCRRVYNMVGQEVVHSTDLDDLIDIATSYVGREWVEHFPEFANRRPNPRRAS